MKKTRAQAIILVVLIVLISGTLVRRQAIQDWIKLRGYKAPQTVSQLATDDTMTSAARHVFYVNKPSITSGNGFTSHCPAGGEKSIVLGCYISPDQGIYLYAVTDSRLQGVEQVTAAHEMLHAAYRRLSSNERNKVDAMLTNYYEHDLTDQRIKDTIAAYKKSEPNDVVNEMHSVFGTEIANLPSPLEQYYQRYFTNRAKVTNYAADYQSEFTSRQNAISQYDIQLITINQQVKANQTQLVTQKAALDATQQQLQTEKDNGQTSAYNSGVNAYNSQVNTYNVLVSATKDLISQYNAIVTKRNAIVLEEQQLTKALSTQSS